VSKNHPRSTTIDFFIFRVGVLDFLSLRRSWRFHIANSNMGTSKGGWFCIVVVIVSRFPKLAAKPDGLDGIRTACKRGRWFGIPSGYFLLKKRCRLCRLSSVSISSHAAAQHYLFPDWEIRLRPLERSAWLGFRLPLVRSIRLSVWVSLVCLPRIIAWFPQSSECAKPMIRPACYPSSRLAAARAASFEGPPTRCIGSTTERQFQVRKRVPI